MDGLFSGYCFSPAWDDDQDSGWGEQHCYYLEDWVVVDLDYVVGCYRGYVLFRGFVVCPGCVGCFGARDDCVVCTLSLE